MGQFREGQAAYRLRVLLRTGSFIARADSKRATCQRTNRLAVGQVITENGSDILAVGTVVYPSRRWAFAAEPAEVLVQRCDGLANRLEGILGQCHIIVT
ncbi:MAG: hypothetical protein NZM31_11525, partial [Gemmatales bacterium]|nr:hypothetical protein [Gemmatales bacterium]MDW8387625.1 hypothetical protein [Gemmatales bacterium]